MFQSKKALFFRISDILLYILNFVLLKFAPKSLKNDGFDESDSQKFFYEDTITSIVNSDLKFNRFRRIYNVRKIVETVTYTQGKRYLDRITSLGYTPAHDFSKFFLNDSIGKPILYHYPNLGRMSPTTLRYISVGLEIKKLFGEDFVGKVVEIGAGYGGQASVLMELFDISDYAVFDLNSVQKLIKKYLTRLGKGDYLSLHTLSNNLNTNWDLAISNYAFSELPAKIQKEYLEKVLCKSERGYLIMNSGLKNQTQRGQGKLTVNELTAFLTNFEILEEIPNSGPDNYVIVWGHNRNIGQIGI